ncbi:uncharacterized protein LOC135114296 isoform X5 [Scylla paramamosain]|uniref:uncharacterized protein LOC135114296 isoform X5 n=1 Tax=Scylla paramamosain TaxID=85552 RepID=UPI0030826CCB
MSVLGLQNQCIEKIQLTKLQRLKKEEEVLKKVLKKYKDGLHALQGAAVVQWSRVRFGGQVVIRRTGSNPGYGPRVGRASTRGNGSQMPNPKVLHQEALSQP